MLLLPLEEDEAEGAAGAGAGEATVNGRGRGAGSGSGRGRGAGAGACVGGAAATAAVTGTWTAAGVTGFGVATAAGIVGMRTTGLESVRDGGEAPLRLVEDVRCMVGSAEGGGFVMPSFVFRLSTSNFSSKYDSLFMRIFSSLA